MSKIGTWPDLLDAFSKAAGRSGSLAGVKRDFIAEARRLAKLPLVRRATRYADIGKNRTWLDGRAKPLAEPARTLFALAMSDHGANQLLAAELPALAAAARLSGDSKLNARVRAQLEEMAAWSPLQRPGWSAYAGRIPPDGKDGNWLATGTGVRAIADALEIMGRDRLPPETVARLDQLLAAEIVSIVDDWTARRPWFVRANLPLTNQWVLPTEGLIRACLVLGRARHRDAYEKGVANLLAHLDFHAPEGSFEEGIHYADFTVQSLMSAARAMALDGDTRALAHPFLRNFPRWALHHFQPGGFFVNAFDAFSAARGNRALLKGTFAMAAVSLASRDALWALDHLTDGPDSSFAGLASRMLPRPAGRPPAPYAAFSRAARVDWRSGWDAAASGLWVRGGHATDTHDHADRGHVNVILRGVPALIEAGTPSYHNVRMRGDYASGRGHNVLQLGEAPVPPAAGWPAGQTLPGWQKARTVAPVTVTRLNVRGGDIAVDGTAGYDGLAQWKRGVVWNASRATIDDLVQLEAGRPQTVLFRWHLGVTRAPRIRLAGATTIVRWTGVELRVEADVPFTAVIEPMPDHTLRFRAWDDPRPDSLHACLVVKTAAPVERGRFVTTVSAV